MDFCGALGRCLQRRGYCDMATDAKLVIERRIASGDLVEAGTMVLLSRVE